MGRQLSETGFWQIIVDLSNIFLKLWKLIQFFFMVWFQNYILNPNMKIIIAAKYFLEVSYVSVGLSCASPFIFAQ